MKRLTQEQVVKSRIREIKRKILHTHNKTTREIYISHIHFLENELRN